MTLSARPSRSRRPRRSSSAGSPAAPSASPTTPLRQARPTLSLTTTAKLAPKRFPKAGERRAARIGVLWQQEHARAAFAAGHVRMIDAGIREHHARAVLGDDQPGPRAQDLRDSGQDHLDQRRVLARGGRELAGARRRRDLGERHIAALGLGDDLVGDHQHVALAWWQQPRLQRVAEDAREIVAGADRRDARRERDRLPRCRHGRQPKRTSGRSFDRSWRRGGR